MTASVTGARTRPVVRSRRTAVTFDSAGGLRVGGIPQFTMAVTDFADLSRDPEPMIVGGRIWSPANLVAAVVNGLRAAEPTAAESGAVATYPATYSGRDVALLRQALDLSGAGDVELVPEPVAAAEWLAAEHGPLEPGFVLVYDLGGTSLDVTVVRVGPDWDDHPMVGKPMRSFDFGGRPLGAMIARYAHETGPGAATATSILSMVDIDGLRAAHVHDTLEIVRDVVRSADLTLSDISRILVIGGASRPAEVARTLAELGRPLVVSADPGHTVAAGAALRAARTMALAASGGKQNAPRVAVFSSAAVVSAVAMSAVTVFGSPAGPDASPILEHFPGGDLPATDSALYDTGFDRIAGNHEAWIASPAGWTPPRSLAASTGLARPSAYSKFITPVAHSTPLGPTLAESRRGDHNEPRTYDTTDRYHGSPYANPAYFINPLPFGQSPVATPGTPGQPAAPIAGTPATPPAPGATPPAPQPGATPAVPDLGTIPGVPAAGPITELPTSGTTTGTTPSVPGTSAGGTTSGGTSTPAAGGSTDTGGATTGGSTSGESTSGSTSGGATSGGSTSGGSDSGSTSGGSTSGGSDSGGSTSGGSTSGGSTSGGSTSGGSTSGGSTSSGSTSTGSTSSDSTSSSSTSGGSTTSGSTSDSSSSGGSSSGGSKN
ncbi:Hsp70 family protein [Nocardia brasiliensis]|uniref:Hsp70 family protein n=1 Tax=Nocardia brasiliensis TaxID=37326 RepID=UPI001892E706|nr:Hsp70 family protein [Nocardia brasiliensis]MBF6547692.1 Hsp70 family protein [Nocardia brasiliensis]